MVVINGEIINFIETMYDIKVSNITKVQGGLSALAYKIETENENYFIKIFDKHRHTAQTWINNINTYIPITLWLYENTKFKNRLVTPVFTSTGSYKCENEDYIFILFPFINGITIADKKLTIKQQKDLAVIIAELHLYGQTVPQYMLNSIEDFNISFCDTLFSLINGEDNKNEELKNTWEPYKALIITSMKKLKEYTEILTDSKLNFVLCHTDVHGWNLMQSDRLILLDWEGLKFAPAEADLFSFTDGFFFDYAKGMFLSAYKDIHPNFTINTQTLDFYRLRRRLEDITAFAEGILYDNLTEAEADVSLKHLIKECSFLSTI